MILLHIGKAKAFVGRTEKSVMRQEQDVFERIGERHSKGMYAWVGNSFQFVASGLHRAVFWCLEL